MQTLMADHPELPLRTRFTGNLIVMKTGETVANKMRKENKANPALYVEADNFVTASDPGFVNAGAGNFALKADSPAFSKIPGFKPIPFDQIGLHLDPFRHTLPAESETRRPVPNSSNPEAEKNFGT